jgi:hypothetical protein
MNHSLKAPGFNPRAYELKTRFQHLLFKLVNLYRYTAAMGGEAWLGFMGNEFGHPEWVDFPREGNDNSFHHARRQWSLRDNPDLFYGELESFDGALMRCDEEHGGAAQVESSWTHSLKAPGFNP